MSVFTDTYIQEGNNNQKEIIELLRSIDEKLAYLCDKEKNK